MNYQFFECTIEPQNIQKEKVLYTIFKILKFIFFILTCVFLMLAFAFANYFFIITLLSLFFSILLLKIQRKYYTFYDYVVVDNEVRFNKIYNNLVRRFITSVEFKNIVKIESFSKSNLSKYNKSEYKRFYAISKQYKKDKLILVINDKNVNKIIIIAKNKNFNLVLKKKVSPKITAGILDNNEE